jgi:hypothetical protein
MTDASLETEADAISDATSGALFVARSRCSIGRPTSTKDPVPRFHLKHVDQLI